MLVDHQHQNYFRKSFVICCPLLNLKHAVVILCERIAIAFVKDDQETPQQTNDVLGRYMFISWNILRRKAFRSLPFVKLTAPFTKELKKLVTSWIVVLSKQFPLPVVLTSWKNSAPSCTFQTF